MNKPSPIAIPGEAERIIAFIQSTFAQAHKTNAIIAVSGGIDSATVLGLTAKALGPAHTLALHLPSKTSRPQNLEHARLAATAFKLPEANFPVLPIGAIIQKSWRIIKRNSGRSQPFLRSISGQPPEPRSQKGVARTKIEAVTTTHPNQNKSKNRLRLANLAARIRMLVLFDQAKKHDALVIGTENLSEHLLGYYTRFGDEASDLEPIRHLLKTQVIDLARHLGVPEPIIAKPPSADLWPGQTDSGELGFSYQKADPILDLIRQGVSTAEIISQSNDETLVKAVLATVERNAFKHQVPYEINTA